MLNKKVAAIGLAAAAFMLSTPAVATAAPDSYAGDPAARVQNAAINSCQRSQVVFDAGYFTPGSRVSVDVAGPAADRTSISGDTAAGDGSLVVSFRPRAGQHGVYTLTFAGTAPAELVRADVPRTYTAVISVSDGGSCGDDPAPAAGPGSRPAGTAARPATPALAATGGDVSPWLVGGGALALAAGGALVGVNASRRARRG